jgi:hypothetical protein
MLRPALRSVVLTTHVTISVGWAGAVAVFVALAVAGIGGDDATVRAAGIAMDVAARFIITPLSFAAPITGLILALGTRWGLVKHYWIVFKLVLTLPSTALLTLHMQPIAKIAETALAGGPMDAVATLRQQMVADAAIALVVLIIVIVLAFVKPRGVTPFYR